MRVDILTIFPEMFKPVLEESIIKRAQEKGLVKISVYDLRNYSKDKHRKVDDRPFGGGPGMVFMPEPVFAAVEDIRHKSQDTSHKSKIILLSPQGKTLNQKIAKRLSKYKNLLLICPRYEGIDERVIKELVDEEISIGDYVLTGGELPAMVLVDVVVRFIPGVVGDEESVHIDTFSNGFLKYPQYTRPADFRGMKVPEVLTSGNHTKIEEWRRGQSHKVTKKKRPDLLRR